MTPGGQDRLREELRQLKDVERPKVSVEIGVAREHGDLRENAEYHAAKERQGFIEGRIKDLEGALSRAEVIDPATLEGPVIRFGATVTLANVDTEETVTYRILGPYEADLQKGSISITAPLARALIGRELGDQITVKTPGGETREYEVLEVAYK
jgi:transcription elongation factor GreA